MFDETLFKKDELVVFALRQLYSQSGYKKYKMSRFEEYDLYSKNKDFLVSDGVITFTDADGRLLALKPDVTLSILKNFRDEKGSVQRFYYNENVYRISQTSHTFREIMQTGLECMGDITDKEVLEVVGLTIQSLETISEDFLFTVSHACLLTAIFEGYGLTDEQSKAASCAVSTKNNEMLLQVCGKEIFEKLECLTKYYGSAEDSLAAVEKICINEKSQEAFCELSSVYHAVSRLGYGEKISIDFSMVNSAAYYSGITFCGYINGVESRVLSGGRYDKLMKRMGRNAGAIGFAVYLDVLERLEEKQNKTDEFINVALPKGRLGEAVYDMFEKAGFECPSIKETNRKLTFENKDAKIRFFWVKPSDVAIYVERGAADLGVAGKDILLEYEPDVYELLDLKLGKCKMAVAAKKDFSDDTSKTLRVATKFSNIARKFYAEKGRDIDIIHLNGSIELAPILGLSDVIVDIVETGKTLAENNLEPVETVVPISARLIANKAAFKFKAEKTEKIKSGLMKGLADCDD